MNLPNSENNEHNTNNNNNNSKSLILDLETLSMQYKNLLIEYENAVNNYVSFLQQEAADSYSKASAPNYNINKQTLVSVPGAIYWGGSNIGQNSSATLQECKASCASTNGCTGATYSVSSNGQPVCKLGGQDGKIVTGSANDTAIVPKGKQLLANIQSINNKLTNINKQIQIRKSEIYFVYL